MKVAVILLLALACNRIPSHEIDTCLADIGQDYGAGFAVYRIVLKGRDGVTVARWEDNAQKWSNYTYTRDFKQLQITRTVKCPGEN